MSWTTPKTWAVGDPGTAADLNTFIRDNTAFLFGDTAWSAPALINGWANTGGALATAGYRLVGNQVWLKGAIGLGATNTIAFQLPAGYRPPATLGFSVSTPTGVTPGAGSVGVDNAGHVVIDYPAGVSEILLDNIRFLVV